MLHQVLNDGMTLTKQVGYIIVRNTMYVNMNISYLCGSWCSDPCVGSRVGDDRAGHDVPIVGLVAVPGEGRGTRHCRLVEAVAAVTVKAEADCFQLLGFGVNGSLET